MNRESVKNTERKRESEADIFCCQSRSWSVFSPVWVWPERDTRCLSPPSDALSLPLHLSALYFRLSLGYWLPLCLSPSRCILLTVHLFCFFSLLLLWRHPLVSVCVCLQGGALMYEKETWREQGREEGISQSRVQVFKCMAASADARSGITDKNLLELIISKSIFNEFFIHTQQIWQKSGLGNRLSTKNLFKSTS